MKKRLCDRTVRALAIAVGLMPLAASASTILSLGGFEKYRSNKYRQRPDNCRHDLYHVDLRQHQPDR